MAPPSSRRSGFSKKAQYSVFTGYLLAALGALLGAGLLALSYWQPGSFAPLRGAASDAVTPVGEVPAAARTGSQSAWDVVSGYFYAGSQNARLREENEIARIRLAEAEAVRDENRRLKALLDLAKGEVEPIATARLVGSSAASARRFAYIGVGRADGLEPGMPVRSPRGVVGRVLEVASGSARVMLLTDSESVLPVRRAGDNTVAFAEGRGDGLLRIRLINLGLNPLKKGDVFVTSGAGGYYRPGVAVAVLSELTPDGGLARLIADPSATDFVSIEPIYEGEAVAASRVGGENELTEQELEE
ncbi:rod shape-determining protein MreC [Erythrobacter litoralis]|jgi:rod shape-determining protein MreC|uniref:Cell shape-determining protein MreC n=1 Tax=Erythrobacter litoralis TaxID=39960 RepID=A0A074N3Y7_9SPHN|nr:rod shape-determining protein MreC [Erythrobacter litoralis]AOL23604.1 rod shape-determining protein MreC [Erythrobacter litoralis]KEO98913.1 rod shape-determining protein MreC [Erythrobacter litoralis]MEE4339660.1 rod shape-determining protein MreC [Erythrobacter sp.]